VAQYLALTHREHIIADCILGIVPVPENVSFPAETGTAVMPELKHCICIRESNVGSFQYQPFKAERKESLNSILYAYGGVYRITEIGDPSPA
jgi:hypothetical protein